MKVRNDFNAFSLLVRNPGPIARDIREAYLLSQKTFQSLIVIKISFYTLLPIIRFITDNLSPIDLINCSISCHTFHANLEIRRSIFPSFYHNLCVLLEQGGHSTISKYLYKLLHPSVCVLSGSIVLQAILGVRWDGSDVDFYCIHRSDARRPVNVPFLHAVLDAIGYTETSYEIDLDNSYYYLTSAANNIDIIHDFVQGSGSLSKVQVIDMKSAVLPETCIQNFDLDIVQNLFDGKVLHIKSIMSITRRIAVVHPGTQIVTHTIGRATGSLVKVLLRLRRLHVDGVIHLSTENWNPLSLERRLKSIFLRIFSRFEKYILRGFFVDDGKNLWTFDNIAVVKKRLRKNVNKYNDDLQNIFNNWKYY